MASCEVPLAATLQAFQIARAAGVMTVLNPAPACALPASFLGLVDVLTPNETELMQLAGQAHSQSIAQAANHLLTMGTRAVLVTLGAAGCALYQKGGEPFTVPAHCMQVADTIGAGDTFTGSLAARLSLGESLHKAMKCANAAAALSVTRHGAVAGIPAADEVTALLDEDTSKA